MSLSGIVLVTGGAGFIGSNIASTLAASGARVRIIDDLSTGHRENLEEIKGNLDFIHASLADEKALARSLEDVELVFHEAAIPSVPRSVENPRDTHEACLNATFSLLLAARDNKVRRLVYAASSSAYGDQPTLPKKEEMSPDPLSPYAVAKLVGEYYSRYLRVWIETVHCGTSMSLVRDRIGSQYWRDLAIHRFADAWRAARDFRNGEQSRDFNCIDNVVRANLLAAETQKGVGSVINVGNGAQTTLNELLSEIKALTGKSEVQAEYRPARSGDVRHSLADTTRARELLGFEPRVGLREGLERTIDWWQQSRFVR